MASRPRALAALDHSVDDHWIVIGRRTWPAPIEMSALEKEGHGVRPRHMHARVLGGGVAAQN